MIGAIWGIARADVARWWKSPVLIFATLIPAVGLALTVVGLTYAVGRQPVALVAGEEGPIAERMLNILRTSDGFFLTERTAEQARADLDAQAVAAVITVPEGFEDDLPSRDAHIDALINNVDLDFSDDIRRSVSEAVVEIDAPSLAALGEFGPEAGARLTEPNPYRVNVIERDLRYPDVSYMSYQLVPLFPLLALTAGALVTALAISGERESGVLRLLALTPRGRTATVFGHLVGGTVASLAMIAVALIPGALLGWIHPPSGRWPVLVALLLLTAISSVAIGVLVGLLVKKRVNTIMVGVNVVAALFLLGGGFTVIAFLPDAVQSIARSVPTFYSVQGIREVLFYSEVPSLPKDLVVLGASALASVMVGVTLLSRSGAQRRA